MAKGEWLNKSEVSFGDDENVCGNVCKRNIMKSIKGQKESLMGGSVGSACLDSMPSNSWCTLSTCQKQAPKDALEVAPEYYLVRSPNQNK